MTIYAIAEKALQAERLAKFLHEQTAKFAVLAANADRKQDAKNMLCAMTRAGELISSLHSLQAQLRAIEKTCGANHRELTTPTMRNSA